MTGNNPNIRITIGRFKSPRQQKRKATPIRTSPWMICSQIIIHINNTMPFNDINPVTFIHYMPTFGANSLMKRIANLSFQKRF